VTVIVEQRDIEIRRGTSRVDVLRGPVPRVRRAAL